ncbi:uncharacterized protein KZ484_016148 isoform 1-T1 [Pholidichthys leucotaenia]
MLNVILPFWCPVVGAVSKRSGVRLETCALVLGGKMPGRQRREGPRAVVSDEVRAEIIDHVVNHGLSLREAGLRVQPNLQRSTVASIVRVFRLNNRIQRLPPTGGRGRIFSDAQEVAIVDMVIANSAIKLHEIRDRVLADEATFGNVNAVSIATIDRILERHKIRMNKYPSTVPFARNGEGVKELRCEYVQNIMEMEAKETRPTFVFVDETGFKLAKARRKGRNMIGHRATMDGSDQRGANITICIALSIDGVVLNKPLIGLCNTESLIYFLGDLHDQFVPAEEESHNERKAPTVVVVWEDVAFHHSAAVADWFAAHPSMSAQFLPPYSPFLNPIEEFLSAWRWKVDHHSHDQMSLLEAMEVACEDTSPEDCKSWIERSRSYFARCVAREDVRCEVDENLWPNAEERED